MFKGISASMMCLNFSDTKKDLIDLEKSGIEYLHFDIMDGLFVPNFTMGPCMINSIRNVVKIPIDIHLMVMQPESKLHFFDLTAGDAVSVHVESTYHSQRILESLKSKGILTGIAFNPGTPIHFLEHILDVIDYVLIMTVNPGFAGQTLVHATLEKIFKTKEYLLSKGRDNISIQVDGNVSFENARKMKNAGADNFVAGTAGLFRKDMSLIEASIRLRESIL